MKRRKAITLILITIIYPLHGLWNFVGKTKGTINPWLAIDYPIDRLWFYKALGDSLAWIVAGTLFFRLSRGSKEIRLAATIFLFMTLADLALFFINFNKVTAYTQFLYPLVPFVSVMFYSFDIGKYEDERKKVWRRIARFCIDSFGPLCKNIWNFFLRRKSETNTYEAKPPTTTPNLIFMLTYVKRLWDRIIHFKRDIIYH